LCFSQREQPTYLEEKEPESFSEIVSEDEAADRVREGLTQEKVYGICLWGNVRGLTKDPVEVAFVEECSGYERKPSENLSPNS
jgi:hypothetical protein